NELAEKNEHPTSSGSVGASRCLGAAIFPVTSRFWFGHVTSGQICVQWQPPYGGHFRVQTGTPVYRSKPLYLVVHK
ncbi:MAG: hypothetical protein O7D30_10605, partial [Rickettsia endosymbiont of Ixodes persulcatus]|nr:hypothetical protein [Rickettsia endosymbiont of Ixodes persulcatus]